MNRIIRKTIKAITDEVMALVSKGEDYSLVREGDIDYFPPPPNIKRNYENGSVLFKDRTLYVDIEFSKKTMKLIDTCYKDKYWYDFNEALKVVFKSFLIYRGIDDDNCPYEFVEVVV